MSSDDEFDGILDEFDNKNTEDKNNFDSVINQTLESLSLNQNNENDDDDDDDNLDSILESVMTELLSKDILYEPLKELSTKYPDYLDNNKPPKLSQEDYDNFKKQHGYVKDVLDIFDNNNPNKDSVLDLMTKIQECGSPPKDIIGDFDSNSLLNDCNLQ